MKKFFLLSLLSITAWSATPVKVEDVKASDSESQARAEIVKSLIEDGVRKNSSYTLSETAPNTLSTTLNRLDKNYLLLLVLKENASSRSRQIKLSNFDEIDTAVSRVVDALLNDKTISETAAKGEVLEQDSRRSGRIKSLRGFELNVGSGIPLTAPLSRGSGNKNSRDPMWALGMGFAWDVNEAFMEMRWDILSKFGDESGTYNAFTLGGNYIWKDDGRVTLFSGAQFGFGNSSNSSYGSGSGFHFGLDTGVLFFRQSDVNLELRLRYMLLARAIRGTYPQILGLGVGLHL